jgi:hypothetical protein
VIAVGLTKISAMVNRSPAVPLGNGRAVPRIFDGCLITAGAKRHIGRAGL